MMNMKFRIPAGKLRESLLMRAGVSCWHLKIVSHCQYVKGPKTTSSPSLQPAGHAWSIHNRNLGSVFESLSAVPVLILITCGHSSFHQGSGHTISDPACPVFYTVQLIPWIPFELFLGNPSWRNLCSEVIHFVFEFILIMFYIKNRNLNVIKLKLSDKHFKNEGHDLDHTDYAMILCGGFFVFNKFSSLIFLAVKSNSEMCIQS